MEYSSLCGQMVGFLHIIDQWLIHTAPALRSQNNSEYLKEANFGINFDEKAYYESLELEDQI